MHALIIEDDAIIAMLIEDELRDLGYSSIDIAVTEDEAIESAARTPPELLTCDGHLLSGSGLSAVRKIQASCSAPVIFITGDPEQARNCFPGMRVVAKPFSALELSSAVKNAAPAVTVWSTPRTNCRGCHVIIGSREVTGRSDEAVQRTAAMPT